MAANALEMSLPSSSNTTNLRVVAIGLPSAHNLKSVSSLWSAMPKYIGGIGKATGTLRSRSLLLVNT